MSIKKYIVFLFLWCSQFCFSQNLIQNGSFEDSLGNPSLNGWTGWPATYDSFFVFPSSDTPFNGGSWSLKLLNINADNYVMWFKSGMQGTYIYKFSVYAKEEICATYPFIGMGAVENMGNQYQFGVTPFPPSWLKQAKKYDIIPDIWTNVTLIDTITIDATNDSIALILHSGGCPVGGYYSYYDLAELIIFDTLTSSFTTQSLQKPNIIINPNPCEEKFTIYSLQNNTYTLEIYNVLGKIVFEQIVNHKQETINSSSLPRGMYFYHALNYYDRELIVIGQGKLFVQ